MQQNNEAIREDGTKHPLINCHTHIFTGDHVPPLLAKTFLVWPFYYLLPLSGIVKLFRWWYQKGPHIWRFLPWYKKIARTLNNIKSFLSKNFILTALKIVAGFFLTVHSFFILYNWISQLVSSTSSGWVKWIDKAAIELAKLHLLWPVNSIFLQVLIVLLVLLFIPSGRNLILFVVNKLWNFMGKLPGKQTKELIKRYISIGRYAFHQKQATIFGQLVGQYPADTNFVVLPMDMEYMEAGRLKKEKRYRQQIEELAAIKKNHPDTIYPFLFADPRRMVPVTEEKNYQPGDKEFFGYTIGPAISDKEGKTIAATSVQLSDCFIKHFIEGKNKFSGIKIYPALGYYPFDEKLLPLWKYAADNNIPVLTHCIRGTIYYRGSKKRSWYEHEAFNEFAGKDQNGENIFKPLLLPQRKNMDFSVNFTHPLNYLCLLEETLLRKLIGKSTDKKLQQLFGYTDNATPLTSTLKNLKICFGHFGGDDEWKKFYEKDRDNYTDKIIQKGSKGIDFLHDSNGNVSETKTEQVWKSADWYSIICSLILQYDNVYGDISYILHDDAAILPLLKQTVRTEKLKDKVLFGTDFYVVRNHKSDKNMLADMMGGLTEEEFDQIARTNPRKFLNL